MKSKNAFILGILEMLLGMSSRLLNKEYLIVRVTCAKEEHEMYLEVPESEVTGSHEWHEQWIDTYEAVIEEIKKG